MLEHKKPSRTSRCPWGWTTSAPHQTQSQPNQQTSQGSSYTIQTPASTTQPQTNTTPPQPQSKTEETCKTKAKTTKKKTINNNCPSEQSAQPPQHDRLCQLVPLLLVPVAQKWPCGRYWWRRSILNASERNIPRSVCNLLWLFWQRNPCTCPTPSQTKLLTSEPTVYDKNSPKYLLPAFIFSLDVVVDYDTIE